MYSWGLVDTRCYTHWDKTFGIFRPQEKIAWAETMPDKAWSVILRSSRTQLLFKTGLKPTKLQEGTTFNLMQALNLRTWCDLTVFAISVFAILVVYHDIMHHNMASMLTALTISKTKGIYLYSVSQIMASVHRNTIRISFVKIPSQLKDLTSRVSKNFYIH